MEGRKSARVARREALYRRILAVADVSIAGLAVFVALEILGDETLAPTVALCLPLVVLFAKVVGLYDRDALLLRRTTLEEVPKLVELAVLLVGLLWLLEGVLLDGEISQTQALGLFGLLVLGMPMGRALARTVALGVSDEERCLVLGDQEATFRTSSKLEGAKGIKASVVGRVPLAAENERPAQNSPIVGPLSELKALVNQHQVDRVIISPTQLDSEEMSDAIRLVKSLGITVSLIPRLFEVVESSVVFENLDGLPILGVREHGLSRSSSLLKRAFDLIIAGSVLVLIAPLLAVVGALVMLGSRGPVLFRQRRIGRGDRIFEMLKFRTMIDEAEALKPTLQTQNEAADGLFKISDDPRLTRIGKVLRSLSFDELPQLWNVLRGDMSLVGPRPLVPEEDAQIQGWHRSRLVLRPGMTGFWQILGSSQVPLAEMVKLDYFYGANWSMWLDVSLLLKTVPFILTRQGR